MKYREGDKLTINLGAQLLKKRLRWVGEWLKH